MQGGSPKSAHRLVEKSERLVSVRDQRPARDEPGKFCEWACDRYNRPTARATGEKPMPRRRSQNSLVW